MFFKQKKANSPENILMQDRNGLGFVGLSE